jgi:hypothetical protein
MTVNEDYPALARLAYPEPGRYGTLAPGQQVELRAALAELERLRGEA